MRELIRFWFTSDERVDRLTYLKHGLGLALVKYAVDAALIWTFAGVLWTPLDYLAASLSVQRSKLAGTPTGLATALAIWTVPFFWVGLTLSARRARDAGVSPWLAQLFFVPLLNYPFIATMCIAPSRASAQQPSPDTRPRDRQLQSALKAIGLGAAAGVAMIGLAIGTRNSYGGSLFFGTPFLIGAVSAYSYNRFYGASAGETRRVVLLTLAITALATIGFAIEGLVCVVMAFPIAVLIALLGSKLGRWIALYDPVVEGRVFIGVLLLPAVSPLLDSRSAPILHEVRSFIEIDAPPLAVWRNVVVFPPLERPTDLLFRSGIAYPVGARIEGEGVGAMRYCEFSTGAFDEPITRWEPGTRLSFDISKNPPPMRELSPYAISPPHLDGYFAAKRGEFRLIALANGRTRLEGSTWYALRIQPEPYWALLADALVSRIHMRVLKHIKVVTESQ